MEFTVTHPTVLALILPSCAILVVDSRVREGHWGDVVSNTYNKLIEMRPNVFIGCFGDCNMIDQVREALLEDLPNEDRSMGKIALFVQDTVNTILENSIDEEEEDGGIKTNNVTTRFVLLGRTFNVSRYYFYNISKVENTWMFFVKREVRNVVCAGSGVVTRFLENNKLDEKMTVDEAVDYGFKCMRYAVQHHCSSGGTIQVVAMKPGSSTVHTWEKNYPSDCHYEYLYQEARIINHGCSEMVSPDGKRASTNLLEC